jgi:tetratricopeptide (TPR) repeat protein
MDSDKQIDGLLKKASGATDNLDKISYLEEVLRLDPTHAEALTRTASAYALLGRNRECLDFARRAVFIDPTKTNAWSLQEHALVGLGIKDKTLNQEICADHLAWCENYLAKHPNSAEGWFWRTSSLAFLGRNQEALGSLDSALKIVPGNPGLIYLRGCVLFDLERKKEAVQTLAQAQQLGHSEAAQTIKQVMETMDSASLKELAGESEMAGDSTTKMETAALRSEAIRKMSACFVATAACGSPFAPEVTILREYRDRILARRRTGLWFIRFYEFTSPPLANWLRHRPNLGALVARWIIAPLAHRAGAIVTQDTRR